MNKILTCLLAAAICVLPAFAAPLAAAPGVTTDSFQLGDNQTDGYSNDSNTTYEVTIACTGPDDLVSVWVEDENGNLVGSIHTLEDGTATAPVSTPIIELAPGHSLVITDGFDPDSNGAGIQALIEW